MRLLQSTITVVLTILLTSASGCGSDEQPTPDTPDEKEDAGDGKVHPPPDGEHVSETSACDALQMAQESKVKALSCSITTRTCPALVRFIYSTPCLEYDNGSVKGCIDHYQKQTTCDALQDAINDCVVTAYPGTEPAGCPAP